MIGSMRNTTNAGALKQAADRIEELETALCDISSLDDEQGSHATGDTPLLLEAGEIAKSALTVKAQKEKL